MFDELVTQEASLHHCPRRQAGYAIDHIARQVKLVQSLRTVMSKGRGLTCSSLKGSVSSGLSKR